MYFQLGYFSRAGDREIAAIDDLCERLRILGFHPEYDGFVAEDKRHFSIFVHLSDEETDEKQVYRMMNRISKEIEAVFGDGTKKWLFGKRNDFHGKVINYRFRHKYWSY